MKPRTAILAFISFTLAGHSQAQTWANSNITATPPTILDWFSGGPNTQATWTGGAPTSGSGTTVTFFADTTTALTNTDLNGSSQISNINNGASAFQLGTLTLNGKGSATTSFPRNANHFESIVGSPLNFSGATGTINLGATLGTAGTLGYQIGSNIQLGTASSASALTLTGNGNGAFFISGNISELQAGGGSLTKSGSSLVTLTGTNTYTGTTSVTAGTLRLGGKFALSGGIGATGGTSALTINGGTVELAADNFLRNLGTGASQFQITGGTSGFSTKFGIRNVIVNNDANQEVQWGGASFNPTQLTLNAASADGQLTLQNKIDLNGATRTINVASNAGDRFAAITTGVIRNSSGTAGLTKVGTGTLILKADNTFNGALTITAGNLSISTINNAGNASPLGQTGSAASLVLNGGTLRYTGAAASTDRAFTLSANSSIDASGSGALNLNNTATPGYGTAGAARTLTLTGTNQGANTLAALLGNNGAGLVGVTKTGTGNWLLSNTSNSFTGVVTVSAGTLSIGSIADGGSTSAMGASTAAASNLLLAGGTLKYTGAAASSNRSFSINGGASAATATIDASGTGALNLTSTATPAYGTASQNRTLVLTGSNTGPNKLSALLTNNTSANSGILVKAGQGKWILNGTAVNTYTGATQVNTGTLEVDFANLATPTNLINSSSALTLGGGTLSLVGKVGTASAQTFGNPTFGSQAGSGISVAGVNGMTLTLGNTWTRNSGSTANVTLGAGGTLTSSPTTANTLVVGSGNIAFATVGGADWAKVSGGNVVAFTSGDYNTSFPASGATGTLNYSHTDNGSVTASQTANTLKIGTSTTGQSLAITSGQTLTLNAGGLLFTGANDYSITGGNLRGSGGTQKELVVHQFGTGNLAISSTITDNGGATALTKTGTGTLTLESANTHTGNTYAGGGGTLVLKHQNALQSSPLILNNSGVVFDSSVTGNAFTIGGLSSPYAGPGYDIVLQNNAGSPSPIALTISGGGTYAGSLSGPGSLIKSGAGNLTMTGYNTYTGGTTINGGSITMTSGFEFPIGRNADGTTHVTINTGGTLDVNATGLNYTMTLNGGTLQSGNSFASDVFGTINLQSTSTFNISNGPMTVSALISGTGGLTVNSPANSGILSLMNANTFSGDTKVTSSLLQIGHPLALQNSILDTTGSIVGTVTGNNAIGIRVATHTFTLGGLRGNKDLASLFTPIFGGSFSTNVFNTSIQTYGVAKGGYAGVTALTLNPGTGATPSYSGVIADGAPGMSVIKTGAGTQTLTGANTYTGTTTVTAGVLAVNGSLANTTTTVTGGTLQGSGSIAGSVTIKNLGTLASGNSIESFATGTLSLEAGSTFAYEMNNDAAASVAGDLTAVTGNLTFDLTNAAILTLAELGTGSWAAGEKLTLISYSGTWNNALFKYLGSPLADDSTFTFSGISWMFNYNDTTSGTNYTGDLTGSTFVTMTAVPEPGAALLGGLGLLALLRRRRV